jgi:hypothetical protein
MLSTLFLGDGHDSVSEAFSFGYILLLTHQLVDYVLT